MTQKQSDNPHANTNKPLPMTNEQLQHPSYPVLNKERSAVSLLLNTLASGKKFPSNSLSNLLDDIKSCASRSDLNGYVEEYFPFITQNSDRSRLIIFTINERLTTFGVAPAWRGFSLPDITYSREVDQLDYGVLSDLRVIDLQWLHSRRKDDSSASQHATNINYRELMNKEVFDYVLAYKVATSCTNLLVSVNEFNLSEDTQRDLVAYKTPEIEQEQRTILSQRTEVEKDIRIAAHRNPRMGKKVLDVMQDRLDLWMSTQATKSSSKNVMYETYKKITGSKIAQSSYNTKFQSLKNALKWAQSKFTI